jgi:hypothetical protein
VSDESEDAVGARPQANANKLLELATMLDSVGGSPALVTTPQLLQQCVTTLEQCTATLEKCGNAP